MNREKFREMYDLLMEQLDVSRELSDDEILGVIDELILTQARELFLSLKEKVELRQELFCSVRKLDVLQELIDDESVTEIMVNGPDHIFVERGGKLTRWNKVFTSEEKLEDVIQQIVGPVTGLSTSPCHCRCKGWKRSTCECSGLSGCSEWSDPDDPSFSG